MHYAFTNWSASFNKFSELRFVGLANLKEMLVNHKMSIALVNTFIYAIVKTLIVTILGLLLAYILKRSIKSRNALRTVYFMPAVLSILVVGLIFAAIFRTRGGAVNEIIMILGLDRIQWFGGRWTGIFAISFAEVWRNVGYAMIISLAGMQAVSHDHFEAACIDGANEWQVYNWIMSVLVIMTLIMVIFTSFKEKREASSMNFILPKKWIWSNYVEVFNQGHVFSSLYNSVFVSIITVILVPQ